MNKKINPICFIFLFIFLISAVSAANIENETMTQIQQPENDDLCELSVKNNEDTLKVCENKETLSATQTTTKENVYLTAPDVKMYYKDGTTFKVTLKDKNKKSITKAKIKITINGVTYNKVTDTKGTTSIALNLKSGTYNVLTSFAGTAKYSPQNVKSTVTVKSTIKCSDFTKYYKNTAAYYATFYDKKGKLLKSTAVKLKLNSKIYSITTNTKGVGKLNINLKPGKYSISAINSKTSETIAKTITIKSLIETTDLTFNETNIGKFNVKILNSYGKASPNKKITLKVDGKTFTKTTNKNGIATLDLNLNPGTYTITTEYSDLKSTNKITVNKVTKTSPYIHTTLISDYVNVTTKYVFQNSYSLKTGINGIIKLPKIETFTVQIGTKNYVFSTSKINGVESTVLDSKNYLIPLDGSGVKSSLNKNSLKGNGIIISKVNGFTQIDYQSTTSDRVELFGFYADKSSTNAETFTYMQNDKITAKVTLKTHSFDETGLRYNLAKYYQKSVTDFNTKSYDEITNHNSALIKFAYTNTPVTFTNSGKNILGYVSKEKLITKFIINGKEELRKTETISYGLSEKYRKTLGFEILQSYSIINEKITSKTLEDWISGNSKYLSRFGVMNVYGMHLASLETTWIADEFADKYAKEYNVEWTRKNTLTILGGINLDDTYLNILNADMGMYVTGVEKNVILFRLVNSMNLPNLEEISLSEVAGRYQDDTTNSLEKIITTTLKNQFSITQLGEMVYIFSEDGSNSAIILNSTSGVSNVITYKDNNIYKGSFIATSNDCCGVGIMPKDIIAGLRNLLKICSDTASNIISQINKVHPISKFAFKAATYVAGKLATGSTASGVGILATMVYIQQMGVDYRTEVLDKKDWHTAMDIVTFTRPGYLQSKKIYNIPNKNGGYDYIEVKINDNLTLDRNNAIYISNGKTKQLTKAETYKYFSNDYWTPINMPTKYWDDSWKGIIK